MFQERFYEQYSQITIFTLLSLCILYLFIYLFIVSYKVKWRLVSCFSCTLVRGFLFAVEAILNLPASLLFFKKQKIYTLMSTVSTRGKSPYTFDL